MFDIDRYIVVKYVYTLGSAGEHKAVTELDRTVEYTYDNLYRLTSETITEDEKVTTYAYSYDNVSNRILKTENGRETEYVYNSLNQLVSDSETTYEYDLNGNLIRVVGLTNSALYEYNAENRLIKVTVQSGNNVIVETYTYDYSGNRTSKTTNTNGSVEYVKYLNDNSSLTNVLAEIDETGTVKCVYTIGADLISQEREGKVSVYVYDGHGSVVGLATMSGKVTDTYKYDAFGNLLKSTGSTANNYLYCGEQFDETTGLYYLRARYMDTSTGRFISQDSYAGSINDPVSLHKYLYANSNPVMYTDPSGYFGLLLSYASSCTIQLKSETDHSKTLLNIYKTLLPLIREIGANVYIRYAITFFEAALALVIGRNCAQLAREIFLEKSLETIAIVKDEVSVLFTTLKDTIANKVEKLSGQKQSNRKTNDHHIVAQTSHKATPARTVLALVGIDVDNPINIVTIKEKVHWFMHTDIYYSWVNGLICESYYNGNNDVNQELANVTMTLSAISIIISGIDNMIA